MNVRKLRESAPPQETQNQQPYYPISENTNRLLMDTFVGNETVPFGNQHLVEIFSEDDSFVPPLFLKADEGEPMIVISPEWIKYTRSLRELSGPALRRLRPHISEIYYEKIHANLNRIKPEIIQELLDAEVRARVISPNDEEVFGAQCGIFVEYKSRIYFICSNFTVQQTDEQIKNTTYHEVAHSLLSVRNFSKFPLPLRNWKIIYAEHKRKIFGQSSLKEVKAALPILKKTMLQGKMAQAACLVKIHNHLKELPDNKNISKSDLVKWLTQYGFPRNFSPLIPPEGTTQEEFLSTLIETLRIENSKVIETDRTFMVSFETEFANQYVTAYREAVKEVSKNLEALYGKTKLFIGMRNLFNFSMNFSRKISSKIPPKIEIVDTMSCGSAILKRHGRSHEVIFDKANPLPEFLDWYTQLSNDLEEVLVMRIAYYATEELRPELKTKAPELHDYVASKFDITMP